jgi:alkylation response protein AidB-like acyl-CoA dehydrogenase
VSARVADDVQREIVGMVRRFVEEQVIPVAGHLDHADQYPTEIVEQMKALGLLGIIVPERYGGLGLDFTTYSMIVEELARGWISVAGVVNTHMIGCYLLDRFGTEEQKDHFLPRMATGELRGAFSLSEPDVGSDVQGLKATATLGSDRDWHLHGQKMWVTGSLWSSVIFVLVKTDPAADPPYRGITCFIAEKEPGVAVNTGVYAGLTISPKIPKMGYRGIETSEVVFDGYRR